MITRSHIRMVRIMKYRSSNTGKFILDGAARIVGAPSMQKTKNKIASGSIASDWTAVGGDLRRSISGKSERLVG